MEKAALDIFNGWNAEDAFSGVFSVSGPEGPAAVTARGYRNIAERLPNKPDTAFAVASVTKLFTALSVCRLIDGGHAALSDRVWDIIPHDLKLIDKDVTLFHLLTHTSGVGDYIDEDDPDCQEGILRLYDTRPVHKWESLDFYLPMFNGLPPKFRPGERTCYSNAGFVLLGLAIESAAGMEYRRYVEQNIILPLNLSRTGFYRMNDLPGNTALGYTSENGKLISNVLYMPVTGGADGGIFTCAADLNALWRAVMSGRVFSADMLEQFLTPRGGFGLGVYTHEAGGREVFYTVGGDFGTDCFSAYFPRSGFVASALGNTEMNTYPLLEKLFHLLG